MRSARRFNFLTDWRRFGIGMRLRLVFSCIVLLMLIGSSFSLWYLRSIRKDVERISLVEQRMSAVLQMDNSVLNLMNQLHRSGDLRDRKRFEADSERLLAAFRTETGAAARVLRGIAPENDRQAVVFESLSGLLNALPGRVRALVELAREDDWMAVHARLLNQVDRTDDVVTALVGEINRDLIESRLRLRSQVEQAELHTAQALVTTGVLSLLLAILLGLAVTRSITRPLASLDAGTRSLAQGQFGGQLPVTGNDELSHLARAFNLTACQLEELYGKLRLSEARFRSLIENGSDMILIVSESGQISYASPSTSRILGGPAEDFVGRPMLELLDGDEAARADRMLTELRQGADRAASFELRLRHRDGSFRSMEGLATNLLTDPAVSGIVINARDVSDRRLAELALREREDQLRQSQKMEAIGRLAGGVAHDFNNLLTVITGYSELLLSALDTFDPRRSYAKDVRDAGQQAAILTGQLLAFSRRQMLNPAVINVNDVVRDTERMLRRLIGEDIELVCRLNGAIGTVEADRNQLQQVLMNLAVNARDAMPHGGRLTIETSNAVLAHAKTVGDAPVLARPAIRLMVTDTGEGMDEATQRRVFEPFFTTKGVGKGTGLGLSTVYGIVTQSGGSITVHSEVGKGTVFTIQLPSTNRTAEPQAIPVVAATVGGRETILVVEDQPEVRALACRALEAYGYRVLEAPDAGEALRLAGEFKEPIDLLLTDVVMPGMNGVELSKRLLSLRPQTKVIFASGYADNVMLQHGVADTGAAFIPKPYGPGTLAEKIREVLGR